MKSRNQLLIGLFFYLVFSLVLFSSGMAQVADGYNYQAVIREGDGSIRANEVALMRFTIAADSNGTNAFYSEQATLNTDQYGLVNHVIGTGSNSSGSLAGINWTVGSKYLIIELNGNAGFEEVSDDKLQAVPFASFADQADYNSLLNRPTLFDGDYNSLTNRPTLFDGDYNSLTNKPNFSSNWNLSGSDIVNANAGKVLVGTFPNNPSDIRIFSEDIGIRLDARTNSASDFVMAVRTNNGGRNAIHVKGNAYVGINNVVPASTFHVRHGDGGGDGISIENAANFNTNRWHLRVNGSDDNLQLRYNGILRGTFNKVNGQYTSNSDLRLKENVTTMESVMGSLVNLKVVRYNFKADDLKEKQIGVIAQEAMVEFPELVRHQISNDEDIYQVDYSGFSMIAIKAIQEQQLQIEELKKELVQKSNSNETLEGRLKAIEAKLIELSKAN